MERQTSLQFLGAAGTVTGSRFLLRTPSAAVLVDAGLFQGLKELRLRNWEPFPFNPAELDAVVLSHAHLDHCGAIPALVREGFAGRVFATEWTIKLAEVVLRDSARLQEEDAEYARRKGYSKHAQPRALYDSADVERALGLFEAVPFRTPLEVAADVTAEFHPAGHVLGAAFLTVTADGRRLLFTGDLGRPEHPLLRPPDRLPDGHFDAIITESTYGDRPHEEDSEQFAAALNRTLTRGGSVLIPAFAVDRTEVVLMELRRLMDQQLVPKVPVFVDSPMALRTLAYYRQALAGASAELRADQIAAAATLDPFDCGTLKEVTEVEESKLLNHPQTPCIIVSASGMGTGGRVVHHLAGMLPNPLHSVLLVGYQAAGTRGRWLADGADSIKMHGRYVPVRAEIVQVGSFSVHADAVELTDWLSAANPAPEVCYVVHGEEEAAAGLAERLTATLGWLTVTPKDGERVRL